MAKMGTWNTVAGLNNATPPDGWPEGQAPSTVNDCAREMMASIRTVFGDSQFVDQGWTPTYVSATSFTVDGNRTSAIHADRRLKIWDATAGAETVIYATVTTASFTAVTTIHISADAGQLTTSLSSFALSILAKNNDALPRNLSIYGGGSGGNSFSSANVTSTLSVGGVTRLGSTLTVSAATKLLSTLTVNGATVHQGHTDFNSSIYVAGAASYDATISSAAVASKNTFKAWCSIRITAGTVSFPATPYGITSVTDNGAGVYDFNFSTALSASGYAVMAFCENNNATGHVFAAHTSGSLKTTTGYRVETLTIDAAPQNTDAAACFVGFTI